MLETANKPKPKIPFSDEKVDDMDCYMQRFEWFAECYHWDKVSVSKQTSQSISKHEATCIYTRLSKTDRRDYDKVIGFLLERFNITEKDYR